MILYFFNAFKNDMYLICIYMYKLYVSFRIFLRKKVNVYQAAVPKEQLYAANINDELSAAWLKRAADPGQTKIETGDFLNFPSVWGMGITIL